MDDVDGVDGVDGMDRDTDDHGRLHAAHAGDGVVRALSRAL